jgi:ATP-dependent Clp protease ATP-binding subunit ClpC
MFDRFTQTARNVMIAANRETMRFNHEYIGTEHILLGLVKVGSGNAVMVLNNLNIDLRNVRVEVEKRIAAICQQVDRAEVPPTPRAKRVIEYAIGEMRQLNHASMGTVHILLGLLTEQGGVAAQVLMDLGLDLEKVRDEIRRLGDAEED